MNCEHCQTLLLDHLYGLLEGSEAAEVDAHLANCPQCSDARAETARVQGLFARAAKSAFPNTKFEPPAPAPQKSHTRTPTLAAPSVPLSQAPADHQSGRMLRRLAVALPWAVAVAVLIAIPGTVVPVLNIHERAAVAQRSAEVADREADDAKLAVASAQNVRDGRLKEAELKLTTAEQGQAALLDKWMDAQKAAVEATTNRKLTIDVQKPATVQPGAPNDFFVVVRDERDVWASRRKMVAEVRSSDAVLYTQELDHEKRGNRHEIRLPASVWTKVKPDDDLTLVVAQVDEKTNVRTPIQEVRLAGPVFTTLLVTDKHTYRPGERLFFRSLTLDRVTLRPPQREQILRYDLVSGNNHFGRPLPGLVAMGCTDLVRVTGGANGRVEPIRTADGRPIRGVGCGEFVLPADLADGDYTLVLHELPQPSGGFTPTLPMPVTRTVKVRNGTADHYGKLIGFAGKSFCPGDTVEAWADLSFQEKPVADAEVAGVAVEVDGVTLDGVEVAPRTDAQGRARVRFALPEELTNGDVRLKVAFRAGGRSEMVADRVPVVGRRLFVEFFPESGDKIVAGVPCKVYVRATTPAGQPVDISGIITDGRETLATVKTLRDDGTPGANRGLASFTFIPQAGIRTWLKLDAPNTVYAPIVDGPVHTSSVALVGGAGAVAARTGFVLPETQLEGVVMSVPDTITAPGQPIRVHLRSVGGSRTLVVGAYIRGRLCDTQRVTVEPEQLTEVKLMAGTDPLTGGRGGVVRITAFEEMDPKDVKGGDEKPDLKPVAERLVFRRPGEVLNLALGVTPSLQTGFAQAAPQSTAKRVVAADDSVTCTISATDEKNNPVAAILWAAVVNTGAAPGAKDRTMPTHFLLAGDVKSPEELEFADFLLTDHKLAGEALDLVLGTQGWRRFAEQAKVAGKSSPPPPRNQELTRMMVQNGQYQVFAEPTAAREYRRIAETYAPLYESAVQAVGRARTSLKAAHEDTRDTVVVREAERVATTAARTADEKHERAEGAREPIRQFRSAVWYGVAGFAALALLCGGVAVARPQTRFPLGASTIGSFGLAAFLFVAAGWGHEVQAKPILQAEAARPVDSVFDSAADAPVAPQPHMKLTPQFDAATVVAAPTQLQNFGANKHDGPEKSSFAPPGTAVPMSGGSKVESFGGPPPKSAGFAPSPPNPPSGLPGAPPSIGRMPDPRGGYGGGGPGGPTTPVPLRPETRPEAKPGAPKTLAGGATGWNPMSRSGVTIGDLTQHRPMGTVGGFVGGPTVYNERVDSLRKDNDKVARYTSERQRVITESLDACLAARGAAGAAQDNMMAQTAQDASRVEVLALQQLRASATPTTPLVVREFAAPRPGSASFSDSMMDAPDTILWQPVIVLPTDGRTTLNFQLGNAPGGYRLIVAGHTADGRLGEARMVILTPSAQTVNAPTKLTPNGPAAPLAPAAPTVPPKP
ncbi:hypothetical protein VT84_04295 [Gemmata sp. SH-PL17]|uniref:zf-HC2 domain-containing protein n=1 Tax=Gemmata sp. SH-PL17 TaxID=1630693 RepID=UPI00078B37C8|nr:zf-HC2 domain-containing protein [Gemmata sp. SH-PL17]AMV23607.1 hypothetical protein VT84_04295 [Gemmata sp. SH-PL17]